MNATFAFVVGLLQTVFSLLGYVQAHPDLPQAQRDQAQQVAQQAIGQATQALTSAPVPTQATQALKANTANTTSKPSLKMLSVTNSSISIAYSNLPPNSVIDIYNHAAQGTPPASTYSSAPIQNVSGTLQVFTTEFVANNEYDVVVRGTRDVIHFIDAWRNE